MTPQELATVLLHKVARGRSLTAVFAAGCGVIALMGVFANMLAAAIGFAIGMLACVLMWLAMDKKLRLGQRILENPTAVTNVLEKDVLVGSRQMGFIRITVQGAGVYEVGMDHDQIAAVAAWIHARNPSATISLAP